MKITNKTKNDLIKFFGFYVNIAKDYQASAMRCRGKAEDWYIDQTATITALTAVSAYAAAAWFAAKKDGGAK